MWSTDSRRRTHGGIEKRGGSIKRTNRGPGVTWALVPCKRRTMWRTHHEGGGCTRAVRAFAIGLAGGPLLAGALGAVPTLLRVAAAAAILLDAGAERIPGLADIVSLRNPGCTKGERDVGCPERTRRSGSASMVARERRWYGKSRWGAVLGNAVWVVGGVSFGFVGLTTCSARQHSEACRSSPSTHRSPATHAPTRPVHPVHNWG